MKTKRRPSRARVSKVPSKPSSMAARALNEMANCNAVDSVGCPFASAECMDQPSPAKRLKRSAKDVKEAHRDWLHDDVPVEEAKDDLEPSVVPETLSSADGCHDEAAPDSTDEVIVAKEKGQFLSSPNKLNWDSLATLDWTEQGHCIKCNKSDHVLICSSSGCPLAIHECCLGCPPSFDDMGNFYCPLCSYKRALAESHKAEKEAALAEEKAHLARNSFSLFVNGSLQQQPVERIHRKELNRSRIAADRNCLGTIHGNGQQKETTSEKYDGAVEHQREAVAAIECTNGNFGVETSLVSERNDISPTRGGEHAKKVCCHERKSVEDQQEAVTAAGHTNGNLEAETQRLSVRNDVSLDHAKQVDSHQCKNVEDQQGAVAAFGCTNNSLGEETSLVSERNDVSPTKGHHTKQVGGHRRKSVVKHQWQVEPFVTCGSDDRPCREESTLPRELFGGPITQREINKTEMVEEHQHIRQAEQQMQTEANMGYETSNSPCMGTETVSAHAEPRTQSNVDPPQKSSSEPSTNVDETDGNWNEENITSRKSVKRQKSAKHSSNPALPNSRRKKLPWTHEEEEMLEVAVQKFSSKVKKKFPWRDILEFGRYIFNDSRTPVDLKDKWRRMVKDGSRSREW